MTIRKVGAVLALVALTSAASAYFILCLLHSDKSGGQKVEAVSLVEYARPLADITGPGAMSPRLQILNGQLFMTWLEPDKVGDGRVKALWHVKAAYLQLNSDTWSQPLTIRSSRQLFINWADAPSITASQNGRLYAHWLEKNKLDAPYAYDIQLAYSDDKGHNWHPLGSASTGQAPHHDAYDGFLSFLPAANSARAFWISARTLDGDGKLEPKKKMTLQTTLIDRGVEQSLMLDNDICSCCNTSTIQTASGPIIFYRNHTPDEIRDIYYVRHTNGAWSEPAAVHHDNWEINGCPVNGPKAATNGELIAIVWFTAAAGKKQLKLAWSRDSGNSFSVPINIDSLSPDGPLGQIGLVMSNDGQAIVSWIGQAGSTNSATLFLRQIDVRGNTSGYFSVAEVSPNRTTGVPQLALFDGQLFLAWTEVRQKQKKIVVIKIPVNALSGSISDL